MVRSVSILFFIYLFILSALDFKGATKLCFMHYLRVAIIFFRAGLCKSYFIPTLLVKLGFCFSIFWFYVFLSLWFLALSFSVLCFEFNVISKA